MRWEDTMADLAGSLVPEDEEEYDLLKDLYDRTGDAYKEGVDVETIRRMLMFVSLSISATPFDGEMPLDETQNDDERDLCPECGEPIGEVLKSLGGDCIVRPCNHEVGVEEL